MVSFVSSFTNIFFIIILIALANFPTCLCRHSKEYKACSKTFNCGNLTGLSYPFYGLDRPAYCGHPAFELRDCDQSTAPVRMTILSQEFLVIDVNTTSSTINVSRIDYFQRAGCPKPLDNITIDFSHFQYTSMNRNLTLLYGDCSSVCSSNTTLKSMVYPCPMSSRDNLPVCFLTKKMMVQNNISDVTCRNRLFLPVYNSYYVAADQPGATTFDISNGAWHGFELRWRVNDKLCGNCLSSGGQCGHDKISNKFFCFCTDASLCPFPGSIPDKSFLTKPKIAILASFSAFGMCLLFIIVCCFRRIYTSRNQKAKQDMEAFLKSYGSPGPKRYSYTDLKRITNSFKVKLGEGSYGIVYKGNLPNGQLVAVKILKKSGGNAGEFINEVASIGMTNHINIVTLLGFCYERQKRALVYEFMPNGSLDKFVYGRKNNQSLAWEKLFEIAIGIARGLEYLHRGCNTRILHFDIKPHNILLDQNFCPKISDFGLAKSCPQRDSLIAMSMSEARGTVGYIAPEVFLRSFGGVSNKSDVYSYGMLVLEMVGCRKKAEAESRSAAEQYFPQWIYRQLELGEDSDDESSLSREERELQRKMIVVSLWCVQTNPSNRPAMNRVVEMLEGTPDLLQIPPSISMASSMRSQPIDSTSTTILL